MEHALPDPLASETETWLKLATTPGLSARAALRAVRQAGGSVAVAARWPVERLAEAGGAAGPGGRGLERLRRRPIDVEVGEVLERCRALDVRVLSRAEPEWPAERFEGLGEPPVVLFVQGRMPDPGGLGVALVGTRRATPYGQRIAREFAEALAREGVCVVSGLALGVDAAAHAGALHGGAGRPGPPTLAVLGHGHGLWYPPENALLGREVAAAGGVISEWPPGTPPEPWRFAARNRLVAALAHVVVVLEAPETSGALVTAARAVELGREVLAVPGSIDRLVNVGSHRLLREGVAGLCCDVRDVFAALGVGAGGSAGASRTAASPPASGPQLSLWTLLETDEARDADTLCAESGLPVDAVLSALAELEVGGRVKRLPGVGYLRA